MIPGYGAGELKEQESRWGIVSHIQAQELGRGALGVQRRYSEVMEKKRSDTNS